MSLDTLERRRAPEQTPSGRLRSDRRDRRWRATARLDSRDRPSRALLVALLLACATLITLDKQGGDHSPLEPARQALGEIFGPVETATSATVRPFVAVPGWFRTHDSLRGEINQLEAENARLRAQSETSSYDRNRLEEYDGLTQAAGDLGYALVPARVVGLGPAQSFSQTVTIDAGSRAGVHPDMTVLNNDGLVGRVLRVTSTTATVLLVIDAESVVGGRVGESMEIGFLHGRGVLGSSGHLELELADASEVPAKHDTVVTWGSESGAPYVSGVPIGRVSSVYSSLRETSQRAMIEPFVDFGSLDLVGVVVPEGSASDRSVIGVDGKLQ